MVNTYAVQSGGCRFESLWGFGFYIKGAHYEVDYSGKKTYLAGLQCTLTSSCAKNLLVSEKPEKKDGYYEKRRRRVGFERNFAHIRMKQDGNV